MYIHEAIRKAQEAPSVIKRPDFGRCFLIVPQSSRELIYGCAEGMAKPAPGWEPLVEDLLADDWEVTKAEGIEWPAPVPKPAQRTWMRFLKYGSD